MPLVFPPGICHNTIMMKNALTPEEITRIKDILRAKVMPYFIVMFGSAASGKLRADSDIDLAFLGAAEIDGYRLFTIAQELADVLRRDVDLIDLNNASTVFKVEIIKNGVVIEENDVLRRQIFNMVSLKDYALLNEERRPILDKFTEVRDDG